MPKRQARLDHRSLLPNDYLNDPALFGGRLTIEFFVPKGGDQVSREVALVQHRLSSMLRQQPDPKRAAAVKAKFGLSPSWWGDCLRGEAWMGETVFAAAIGALLDTLPALETDSSEDARS